MTGQKVNNQKIICISIYLAIDNWNKVVLMALTITSKSEMFEIHIIKMYKYCTLKAIKDFLRKIKGDLNK